MALKILVLCTGNSCRSQMAEGWIRALGSPDVTVHSAGLETHGLNPGAVAIMAEFGIDISGHKSELVDNYYDQEFDIVLTVCDHANETCPTFPGSKIKRHHNFTDPSKVIGDPSTIKQAFRQTCLEIRDYAARLLEEFGHRNAAYDTSGIASS